MNAQLPKKMPTLPELIEARDRIVECLREWAAMKDSIEAQARQMDLSLDLDSFHNLEKTERQIEVGCWHYVLEKSNVLASMTEKAKNEYLEKIEKKPPRFCLPELEALIQNAGRIYSAAFDQTIKEVHRQFIGCGYHGGDWRFRKKDNLKKIEHLFRCLGPITWGVWHKRFACRSGGDRFEDLLTACNLLEGNKKPDYSNNFYSLAQGPLEKGSAVVQTPYFSVQAFKNGNHLVRWNPEKEDVLLKLNYHGTEGGLPDTMRKRYKPEHFSDSRFDTSGAGEKFKAGDDPQFFPTPRELAERVLDLAEVGSGLRWLEPGAGDGGLALPLRERTSLFEDPGTVQCFELDHSRFLILEDAGFSVEELDFLKVRPGVWAPFDRVIMNPPFHNQADVYHVLHALQFLRPGGGLVAIMSAAAETRGSRVSRHLRQVVSDRGGRFEPNPPGSFRQAGTDVATVTLVIPPKTPDTGD